jgi:hypothetical protein
MKTTSNISIQDMEQALRGINFFVGGLTDAGIVYYYHKLITTNQ